MQKKNKEDIETPMMRSSKQVALFDMILTSNKKTTPAKTEKPVEAIKEEKEDKRVSVRDNSAEKKADAQDVAKVELKFEESKEEIVPVL